MKKLSSVTVLQAGARGMIARSQYWRMKMAVSASMLNSRIEY